VQYGEGVVSEGLSDGIFMGVGEWILVKYVVNRLNLLPKNHSTFGILFSNIRNVWYTMVLGFFP
jgi:hypothetical protein